MLRERVPNNHLEGSLVKMYFPSFSLENKLFGIHKPFLPVEAREFSELKTPSVHTFFSSEENRTRFCQNSQRRNSRRVSEKALLEELLTVLPNYVLGFSDISWTLQSHRFQLPINLAKAVQESVAMVVRISIWMMDQWWIDNPLFGGLEHHLNTHLPSIFRLVTGKALDSPEKGNVDKMSEECRKSVIKLFKACPEGLKRHFSDFLAHVVDAFVWWPCPMRARYNFRP